MKNAKRKDFLVEIWRSMNRFLSILFIVALGVAFFAGIRSTRPDMEISADQYYDETKLMDIRVLGTLGLTEGDVEAVGQIEGVKLAMGAYTTDVLCKTNEQEQTMRIFSATEGVNQFTVVEGRMPERSGECLIDKGKVLEGQYQIGETVQVYPGTDDELEDTLHTDTYTIVGIGMSSRYLSLERGTTSIGNGSLDSFMVVMPEDFALEVYSDIYVLTERGESMTAYSKEYDDYIETIADRIDDTLSEERSHLRFMEVVDEANETLQEAREELAEKSEEADEELADAAGQIADADKKIADGRNDIEQGQKDIEQGKADLAQAEKDLADGKKKLAEKEQELEDGKVTLAENEQELADAKATLAEKEQELADAKVTLADNELEIEDAKKEVAEKEIELEDGWTEFEERTSSARSELEYGWEDYEYGLEEYESAKESLAEEKETLKDIKRDYGQSVSELTEEQKMMMQAEIQYRQQMISEAEKQLRKVKDQLDSAKRKLNRNQKKIDDAENELYDGEEQLADARKKITDGEEKVAQAHVDIADADRQIAEAHADIADADRQIAEAHADITDGEQKIAEAHEEIRDGESKIPKAREDIAKGEADIADAIKTLEEGEADLADAKIKYADAQEEAKEKIGDAQIKIDDAQKDIDDLEEGEWFVLDRGAIQTYVEYGSDAERIGAIGEVFPFIFFLVAALVSLTTMTRMVEEQRLQIGTLKALGYGKWIIASKYIVYASLATVAGSILGVAVGEKVLPYVIMTAYFILYENLPVLLIPYQMEYGYMATGLAVGCTVAAAVAASYKELLATPAALMRPVPPKQGKRVALEYVTPIWKRMNFIQKATVRNLFRYKKRCLMTVFGIGGCMALLLVGFGLKDSISTLGERQYNDVWTYDLQVGLDEDAKRQDAEMLEQYLQEKNLGPRLRVEETILDVVGDVTKEAYLFVPEDVEQAERFVHLRNRQTGETLRIDDQTVLITEKLASLLNVEPGDTIYLKEDEETRYPVEIGGIAENYLNHYVYMSPLLYKTIYGEETQYNRMFMGFDQPGNVEEDALGTELLSYDAVTSVVFIETMRGQIDDMLDSLNVVIWVLIISAGLLAFVVLYNLNNININERLRELATIKLLGFYDMELAAYVYRENVMLTLLGSAVGAVLGYYLHRYVMLTVEVDMLMFGRQIRPVSYLYSILLTCAFSIFVNGVMYFKLKKIDMVESLKSVE